MPAVEFHRRVGSTNDVARTLAERGADHGTLVLAEEQTAGRGRSGRKWHALPGRALLISFVLRPSAASVPVDPARTTDGAAGTDDGGPVPQTLPLRIGLALARSIETVTGLRAGIKWPNDLLIDGRKVAGILCEGVLGGEVDFTIVGVGVNVNGNGEEWPEPLRRRAVTLEAATGRSISRAALAGHLVPGVLRLAGTAGPLEHGLVDELAGRDALRDRPVTLDGQAAGTAVGIAADGELRVREPGGATRSVRNGTVRLADDERD